MTYNVIPLFSTPLLHTHLGKIDPESLDWIFNLEYIYQGAGLYGNEEHLPLEERGFNVLNQPQLLNLQRRIKTAVDYFAYNVLDVVNDVDFELTTSWINKINENDYVKLHNHANSVISGVYYPYVYPGASSLKFIKNKQHLNSFSEHVRPETKGNWNQFTTQSWIITPKTGDIVIFPSHLEHEVPVSEDKNDRYSLAFNYFPRGKLGMNSVRNYI